MDKLPTEYCFLWINWWPFCMPKAEWATWVQAIFSVIAIVAAIAIAGRQHREDRDREARLANAQASRQMTVLTGIADHAAHCVRQLPQRSSSADVTQRFYETFKPAALDGPIHALRMFGPSDVPDGSAFLHATGLVRCLEDAQRHVLDSYPAFLQRNLYSAQWEASLVEASRLVELSEALRVMLRNTHQRYDGVRAR